MAGSAVIGARPGGLVVYLRRGEPTDTAWTARRDGQPIPWAVAPVLHLPGGATVTAALSPSGVVADAVATWAITAEQATTALAGPDAAASVTLDGRTIFAGRVVEV